MITRIVSFTLGDGHEIVARTHMALLTALAWAPRESELCLVTDRPDLYRWFEGRVRLLVVDGETVRRWHGPHGFFWRVKVEAVRHAAAQGGAHVLYLDSDVLVQRPLDDLARALEAGEVFLHKQEHELSRPRRRGDRRLWRQVCGRTAAGLTFASPCAMWNAGVVAVGASRQRCLEQALEILDSLNDQGCHHVLMEQLAFSAALAATGRLRPAEPWMAHYWGNKPGHQPEVERQLVSFLYRGLGPEAAAGYVREHPIVQPLQVRPGLWRKAMAHLRRRRRA